MTLRAIMSTHKQINILYIFQGADFAGAESYALNLIKKISCYKDMKCFAASCYKGPLLDYLEQENVVTFTLYGKNNMKSILAVINYVRIAKIDIIHCLDIKSTIVGGIAALFLKNIKTVSTVHGLPEPYKSFGKQLIFTISLAIYFGLLRFFFDAKICVSNDLKKRLIIFIGANRAEVIHNGIELDPIEKIPTECLQESKISIGTVGRLDEVKGHDYLLSAAQMILSERDDIVFFIIGTGPLEKHLKETVSNLGLAEKILFLGFRPDAKFLIAGLDIFVLPSLHEGIPYVLLEAMASRKPVVCTNVGGVPEIVTHNDDGILVPPKDPNGLYNAIKSLLSRKDYIKYLGDNAYHKIEQFFSSTLMAEKTYSLYVKLLTS
jgi:glycosyltransferase involved in cell wall biosynthesis